MTAPAPVLPVQCRAMRPEDAPAVSSMVYAAFRESIASEHSEEGQREFFEFAAAERLLERAAAGHEFLVATRDAGIVGVIEVRPPSHVAQLFVDSRFQGMGVARSLLDAAFPESRTAGGLTVTVNATPDAVSMYGRMGFKVIAAEQMRSGVRFVPMIRTYGPLFFPVSALKFGVLSVWSLGIYPLVWIFRNWRYERDRTGETLSPFWRSVFAPLFLHSLFHRVKRLAGQVGVPALWSVGLVTLATIALWATVLVRAPWNLLSLLAFVPAIPVQLTVNRINRAVAPTSPSNSRFTMGNILVLLVGTGVLFVLLWWTLGGGRGQPSGAVSV